MKPISDLAEFADALHDARRILVIDTGGLGDHLHSLPALWLLRRSLPQAQLQVMGGGEVFTPLAPWIDRILPYSAAGLAAELSQIGALRRTGYDAAIVMTSSNHAVAYGGLCGAPLRLARRADQNKRWQWQPWLLTHVAEEPFHTRPMYQQRWAFLHQAGFAGPAPTALADVSIRIEPAARWQAGIDAATDGQYLHLSASATDDRRDLPLPVMASLWNGLHEAFPDRPMVVSANGTPRGRAKLQALLQQLRFRPWRIFDGTLDTAGFASVVQGAALHVGPDSGGLHVARIAGTPGVSWFRPNHHILNWFPDELTQRAFVAPESREDGLYGLPARTLVDAAIELFAGAP